MTSFPNFQKRWVPATQADPLDAELVYQLLIRIRDISYCITTILCEAYPYSYYYYVKTS